MHEKLETIRKERNLSQNQLAIMSGISQGTFNMALRGRIPFYKGWRHKVACALGMSENDVFPEFSDKEVQTQNE